MSSSNWETIDSEIVNSYPKFQTRRDEVRLADGSQLAFHYVTEPPGVVILPFTRTNEVVIIEEWRQSVERVTKSLPAGTVEESESPAEAVRRELAEETGYEPGSIRHLQTIEPSNGVTNAVHHHFVATGCERTREQDLDTDESIRVAKMAYGDLLDTVLANEIRDGRTISCMTYYELTTSGDPGR